FYICARAEGAGPFGVGQSGLRGNFTGNFFFVKIGGGGAIRNLSPTRSHTRGEEQRRHQLRLSGAAVADNANVANVLGEIRLHTDLPICAACGVQARSVLAMAGAGLRLGELRCWGRRAWPLASRRKFASTKFAPLN